MVVVGIVGSRSFSDRVLFDSVVGGLDVSTVVSGGASGADSVAKSYASDHGLDYLEFLPDWSRFGRSAGPRRKW